MLYFVQASLNLHQVKTRQVKGALSLFLMFGQVKKLSLFDLNISFSYLSTLLL